MELFTETVSKKIDYAAMDQLLEKLEVISPNAHDASLHALLYGFSENSPANPPLEAIKHFVQKVISAAEKTGNAATEESRRLAQQAADDRLDPDNEQVKTAAFKVTREFDRLRGILRFKPETSNKAGEGCASAACYIARCAPDHFVLPLLANHFWQRFGKQSWAIIDDRRKLVLTSDNGKTPVLRKLDTNQQIQKDRAEQDSDEWECLWKDYHRSINNEDRSNPKLQKQFMPLRYWKYLTEFR